MAAKSSHIHKLKRHTYKTGSAIFHCTLPDCYFKIAVELALGKRVLCNRCGQPFQINEYSIRLAKPHCNDCLKRKDTNARAEHKVTTSIAADEISSLRSRLDSSGDKSDSDVDL